MILQRSLGLLLLAAAGLYHRAARVSPSAKIQRSANSDTSHIGYGVELNFGHGSGVEEDADDAIATVALRIHLVPHG